MNWTGLTLGSGDGCQQGAEGIAVGAAGVLDDAIGPASGLAFSASSAFCSWARSCRLTDSRRSSSFNRREMRRFAALDRSPSSGFGVSAPAVELNFDAEFSGVGSAAGAPIQRCPCGRTITNRPTTLRGSAVVLRLLVDARCSQRVRHDLPGIQRQGTTLVGVVALTVLKPSRKGFQVARQRIVLPT